MERLTIEQDVDKVTAGMFGSHLRAETLREWERWQSKVICDCRFNEKRSSVVPVLFKAPFP